MISFRESDYMYSYNKMKPKAFSTHLHKYYEFLYFAGGDATYVVEGTEYSASDGDLFITCPGELHSIAFKSHRDYERHFIQISDDFLQGVEFDFLKILREKKNGSFNKISHLPAYTAEIERCFMGVQSCVTKKEDGYKDIAKSYIIQLLSLINKLLYNQQGERKAENERVSAAKDYINSHLSENLALDAIAEASYTDRFYLSHLFKKEMGISITDYIGMQRIAMAKKLISQGGNASKIYSECGFNDYSSFYRAFKKLSGKSPAEFFKNKKI
ncbi:MAG: AraC family transcriptional regulator [Clostridia bacterium]|nr:AraC family transcriptional regulator [Clostridia bacterium]